MPKPVTRRRAASVACVAAAVFCLPVAVSAGSAFGSRGEAFPAVFLDLLPYSLGLPAVALIAVLVMEAIRRLRDDRAVAVEFSPPGKITPTEAGILVDGKVHQRDILATVFDLAVRGYVRIRKVKISYGSGMDYELRLVGRDFRKDPSLKPHEIHILGLFFGAGRSTMMSRTIGSGILLSAKDGIEKRVFGQMSVAGLCTGRPPRSRRIRAELIGLGLLVPLVLCLTFATAGFVTAETIVFLLLASACCAFWIFHIHFRSASTLTEKGRRMKERVMGFRDYLETAERHRLEWGLEQDIYGTYMPYALSFGVLDAWSRNFAGWSDEVPDWFESTDVYRDMAAAGRFVQDIGSMVLFFGASLSALKGRG